MPEFHSSSSGSCSTRTEDSLKGRFFPRVAPHSSTGSRCACGTGMEPTQRNLGLAGSTAGGWAVDRGRFLAALAR